MDGETNLWWEDFQRDDEYIKEKNFSQISGCIIEFRKEVKEIVKMIDKEGIRELSLVDPILYQLQKKAKEIGPGWLDYSKRISEIHMKNDDPEFVGSLSAADCVYWRDFVKIYLRINIIAGSVMMYTNYTKDNNSKNNQSSTYIWVYTWVYGRRSTKKDDDSKRWNDY